MVDAYQVLIEYSTSPYRFLVECHQVLKENIMLVTIITELYADGLIWVVGRDTLEFETFEDAEKFAADGCTFDGVCGCICYIEIIP